MTGTEDSDEPFRPPLPQEDRLWRHPSEVAASQRALPASTIDVSTVRTPLKHAVGLATMGAVGGALVVAGLFLTLGGTRAAPASEPVFQTLAVDPIVPIAQPVPADVWPAKVANEILPSLAQVEVNDGTQTRLGSGVLFRPDGYLLTSSDLVGAADQAEVRMRNGDVHDGVVLGTDSISGLAVVRIDVPDSPAARLAIVVPPPKLGDYAVALSGTESASMTMTTVSGLDVEVPVSDNQNLHGLIQVGGGMPEGGSGGAIVDDTGSVIGIVVDLDTEHGTYAVPIGYARKIAEDILTDGRANHPWLGIRGADYQEPDAEYTDSPGAVRLQSVITNSPAHRAGLGRGDLITAVEGRAVGSMTELVLELRRHVPGETIELTTTSEGTSSQKSVMLEPRLVGDTT